jgi:hypothetical protein
MLKCFSKHGLFAFRIRLATDTDAEIITSVAGGSLHGLAARGSAVEHRFEEGICSVRTLAADFNLGETVETFPNFRLLL